MIIKYYEDDFLATPELRSIRDMQFLLNKYRDEYAKLVKTIAYLTEALEGQISESSKQFIFNTIKKHKEFDQQLDLEYRYGEDGIFYEVGCYSKLDPLIL